MFTDYFQIDDNCRLFYKVYSSRLEDFHRVDTTQPTLIFLHGGPGVVDHTIYEPFWSKFAGMELNGAPLQVIFIDQRGCGRSYMEKHNIIDYGPSEKWNLKQWGQDVRSFYTGLSIVKPIIAGVSFGGVVAMSCATQFPVELAGLILSDTDAQFNLDEVLSHFELKVKLKGGDLNEIIKVRDAAKRMLTETSAEVYQDYVRYCIPYCAVNPYKAELIAGCVKNEKSAYYYNRNELTKFNFIPKLKRISCHSLVMTGDQNPVHTLKSAIRTAEALRKNKVTFKIFHGAGSPVYADKELEVAEIVKNFLIQVTASQALGGVLKF